ncbi:MAG: YciI family protein [Pseudonocardiaceae bacterium]
MKQYLLSVHYVEGRQPPAAEVMQEMYEAVTAFNADLKAGGAWVFAGGLHTPEVSSVVESRGGEIIVTDGPFAESKEQLGGMWIVRAEDLDAALELAERAAVACRGPVEVRPFQDEPEATFEE